MNRHHAIEQLKPQNTSDSKLARLLHDELHDKLQRIEASKVSLKRHLDRAQQDSSHPAQRRARGVAVIRDHLSHYEGWKGHEPIEAAIALIEVAEELARRSDPEPGGKPHSGRVEKARRLLAVARDLCITCLVAKVPSAFGTSPRSYWRPPEIVGIDNEFIIADLALEDLATRPHTAFSRDRENASITA